MKRAVLLILAFVLLAPLAFATPESDDSVSATQASATVSFSYRHNSILLINDGANEVYIRVWAACEDAAAIAAGDTGTIMLKASENIVLEYDEKLDCPKSCQEGCLPFKAISHICSTGETATFRWFAK